MCSRSYCCTVSPISQAARRTTMARKCEQCGGDLTGTQQKKFCGHACWYESRKWGKVGVCEGCGKTFLKNSVYKSAAHSTVPTNASERTKLSRVSTARRSLSVRTEKSVNTAQEVVLCLQERTRQERVMGHCHRVRSEPTWQGTFK